MAITDWPECERPREKLLQKGPDALSAAELLAIFLRTGIKGKSAVDLARDLLSHFGSLANLFGANREQFCKIDGMGVAKYAQLQAVMEMAKRALHEQLANTDALTSPLAVRDFLKLSLRHKDYEVFLAIFLDTQNRIISAEEMFRGTLNQTSVYPREIVKQALYLNAAATIFAHNHPSGVAQPSEADKILTRSLKQALAVVDVKVLDHFIVAADQSVSFAELGLL